MKLLRRKEVLHLNNLTPDAIRYYRHIISEPIFAKKKLSMPGLGYGLCQWFVFNAFVKHILAILQQAKTIRAICYVVKLQPANFSPQSIKAIESFDKILHSTRKQTKLEPFGTI